MASPCSLCLLLAGFSFIAICNAGPLGPLPNVTSSEVAHNNGSCAVGAEVYQAGSPVPGSGPCERCTCAAGSVSCSRTRCEPRPGCKALHRPDQCCPTYQCECEQDGRTYGNGEKLVDPADPCRVCYCQGGEVVCRRIACFRRDDCLPRLVPGRCCPEYDNCPLRGVTAIPGAVTTTSSVSSMGELEPSDLPPVPKENIKQEITIKEITPVSEIPVITDVKIKEILPSPSIDVAEYSSSKSPLIPREATSEKSSSSQLELTEQPVITEIHPSSSSVFVASSSPEITASSSEISETKRTHDLAPSKISFSTQDSINSDIYPSNEPSIGTVESHSVNEAVISVATTMKPTIVLEEEDLNVFDHNPAFPPIPDDLSLVSNHQDEISSDPSVDGDHISSSQDFTSVVSTFTETPVVTGNHITSVKDVTEDPTITPSTPEVTSKATTVVEESETSSSKPSLMLNLRSAIPTEILNVPSYMPEDITGELDDIIETSTNSAQTSSGTTTEINEKTEETVSNDRSVSTNDETTTNKTVTADKTSIHPIIPGIRILEVTTPGNSVLSSTKITYEPSTTVIAKSNVTTEITAQTEFSSLPIETSDQNPHEESTKEKLSTSSAEPTVVEVIPTNLSPIEPEIITISRDSPINTESHSFETVETTEFVLTSFGLSETATDAVEVIKISPEVGKSAAIIESTEEKKHNMFADLINLVGDVASIKDHTDRSGGNQHVTNAPTISDSEELIPVNAGYKSKNSNWNLNSITEVPKTKHVVSVIKQKVIEIEDDESDNLTDSPPPNDKVEPTTRRPIIDNVSDDKRENKTDKKDIEIISQTYVPTVERRPTKVVMKKNNERPISESNSAEGTFISASSEATTDGELLASNIQADDITIERRPAKLIMKESSEKPVAEETSTDEGGLLSVSSEINTDGKVFTPSEFTTAPAVKTAATEMGSTTEFTTAAAVETAATEIGSIDDDVTRITYLNRPYTASQ